MNTGGLHIPGLVDRCKKNNRLAQQEMYRHLYPFAYSITYRYAKDNQEANTLVNDSFLKLFKHIGSCKLNDSNNTVSSFMGWFKKIIVNTCIDHYRSNKNKNLLERDSPSPGTDNSETGEDKLGYKDLINTVKQLSPAYRTVFNLHVIEGFSHEEIADLLAISVGTSKSNLSKAKEHLRNVLKINRNYTIPKNAAFGP